MATFGAARAAAYDAHQRREHYRSQVMGLSAFERHQKFVRDYVEHYGGAGGSKGGAAVQTLKSDRDALHEAHRFIRTTADDADGSWSAQLARRYYSRLFKEYCIADLSRYKESKLGLRWRTKDEVLRGVGQFECGAVGCDSRQGLCSYEVNFAYSEAGQRKQALVKLRVCPACAYKLNYKKERAFEKAQAKAAAKSGSGAAAAKAAENSLTAAGRDAVKGGRKRRRSEADEEGLLPTSGSIEPPPPLAAPAGQGAATAVAGSGQTAPAPAALPADESLWAQPAAVQTEATIEEEIDEYFDGMFL